MPKDFWPSPKSNNNNNSVDFESEDSSSSESTDHDRRYITEFKAQKNHGVIAKGFEWPSIPELAIITGKNGAGKTHLLAAIQKKFLAVTLSHVKATNFEGDPLVSFITEEWSPKSVVNIKDNKNKYEAFNQQILFLDKNLEAFLNQIKDKITGYFGEKRKKPSIFFSRYKDHKTGIVNLDDVIHDMNSSQKLLGEFPSLVDDVRKASDKFLLKVTDNSLLLDRLANIVDQNHQHFDGSIKGLGSLILAYKGIAPKQQKTRFYRQEQDLDKKGGITRLFADFFNEIAQEKYKLEQRNEPFAAKKAVTNVKNQHGIDELPWVTINSSFKKTSFPYRIILPTDQNISYYLAQFERVEPYTRGNFLDLVLSPQLFQKKTRLYLHELSSGERKIASAPLLAFDINHQAPNSLTKRKLLLLDEPDAHFHHEMIEQFMGIVQDVLVRDMKIQVIMTTHNLSTVSLAPKDSLFLMKRDKNNSPFIMSVPQHHAINNLSNSALTVLMSKNRKTIYVEAPNDAKLYTKIWSEIVKKQPQLERGVPLDFYAIGGLLKKPKQDNEQDNGSENSGCGLIRKYLNSKSSTNSPENYFIHGLLDQDNIDLYSNIDESDINKATEKTEDSIDFRISKFILFYNDQDVPASVKNTLKQTLALESQPDTDPISDKDKRTLQTYENNKDKQPIFDTIKDALAAEKDEAVISRDQRNKVMNKYSIIFKRDLIKKAANDKQLIERGCLTTLDRYSMENYYCDPINFLVVAFEQGSLLARNMLKELDGYQEKIEALEKAEFLIAVENKLNELQKLQRLQKCEDQSQKKKIVKSLEKEYPEIKNDPNLKELFANPNNITRKVINRCKDDVERRKKDSNFEKQKEDFLESLLEDIQDKKDLHQALVDKFFTAVETKITSNYQNWVGNNASLKDKNKIYINYITDPEMQKRDLKVCFTMNNEEIRELAYPNYMKRTQGHSLEWAFSEVFLTSDTPPNKSNHQISFKKLVEENDFFNKSFLMPEELIERLKNIQTVEYKQVEMNNVENNTAESKVKISSRAEEKDSNTSESEFSEGSIFDLFGSNEKHTQSSDKSPQSVTQTEPGIPEPISTTSPSSKKQSQNAEIKPLPTTTNDHDTLISNSGSTHISNNNSRSNRKNEKSKKLLRNDDKKQYERH